MDAEKRMFVMFLLFAVHSLLYMHAPLVSGLSVLLLLGFFISLSVYGSSPPPHILILCLTSRFELFLSLSLSFAPFLPLSLSLALSLYFFLCLFDALMVG